MGCINAGKSRVEKSVCFIRSTMCRRKQQVKEEEIEMEVRERPLT